MITTAVVNSIAQEWNARVLVVDQKDEALRYLNSKSVVAWGNGQEVASGIISLAQFSPRENGALPTLLVCEKTLVQ